MVAFPSLTRVHVQVYQIDLRAPEHAGDLPCGHDPYRCFLL